MKVIKVYDKNSDIRCYNKNIFKATEALLANFPREYSNCYYHNLESLELIQVDKFMEASLSGFYNPQANVIRFKDKSSLGHELFHMASNDLENGNYAFASKVGIEDGLIEGMTEYFNMKAYGLPGPTAYPLEVFCVTMLEDIPDIFRSYFIPNNRTFINLFPNRRDIYSLFYSLDAYNEMYMDFLETAFSNGENNIDMNLLRDTIKDIFNSLVEIELSLEEDPRELKKYDYKFMEYIGGNKLAILERELYPKYYEYADKLIDKKIRKRIK